MNREEINYKIKERAENIVTEQGSVNRALTYLKLELKEFEDSWSKYSSDSLGHGITCNRLLINWLEHKIH